MTVFSQAPHLSGGTLTRRRSSLDTLRAERRPPPSIGGERAHDLATAGRVDRMPDASSRPPDAALVDGSGGDGGHERVAPMWSGGQFDSAHTLPSKRSSDRERMAPTLPPQDLDVVARLVAGDERALGMLYDRHVGMAFGLASAMMHDPADAEEVVADAFAQIWRSAASFDPSRGSVLGWISTIVRTRALDLLRSQKRRARVLESAAAMSEEGASPALAAGAPSPDRGVELSEAQRLVRQALDDLPRPQRHVLELAYFGGLSQSEIAEQLSEPLGTVKTRMRAGMEKMRSALRPLLENPS